MESEDDSSGVVHFDYDLDSSQGLGPNKGKYYKQTYRTAWEQMPDFKGWLRGMPGQPTRAFCMYCQKSLHAHRLSLLKHTCTIRHQKAAQLNIIRQQQRQEAGGDNNQFQDSGSAMENVDIVIAGSSHGEEDTDADAEQTVVSYDEDNVINAAEPEEDNDNDNEDGEDEAFDLEQHLSAEQVQKQVRNQGRISIMNSKPVISTHVLDTSKGQPVSGLQVSLYKLIDGRWTYINEGLTNPDGRFGNFLTRDDFTAGRYKLHFDVDRYFELKKQDSLYPFIEIVFDCRAPGDHYHIPLLLGPFGYTTYRGS